MRTPAQKIYNLYRRLAGLWPVATAAGLAYTRLRPAFSRAGRTLPPPPAGDLSLPVVAFVCDEMTWQDFSGLCRAVFVTPQNWRAAFDAYAPRLFFCESAWSGIDACPNSWRGRVYKNSAWHYQNRRELFAILDYCRGKNIPTVFWNKEDPAYFEDEHHNFAGTALHFKHIFTTAAECVPQYEALGHSDVGVLPFGYNPALFYPPPAGAARENTAVFAGSWFEEYPARCRDMAAAFDMVLAAGIKLVIYDRQSGSSAPGLQYPEKYRPFVRPAISFAALGDIYRGSRYAVTINTVTDSETMFARRAFELMACGCVVVSNPAKGLERLFPGRIWFTGQPFDHAREGEIVAQNLADVQKNHTAAQRWQAVLDAAGL